MERELRHKRRLEGLNIQPPKRQRDRRGRHNAPRRRAKDSEEESSAESDTSDDESLMDSESSEQQIMKNLRRCSEAKGRPSRRMDPVDEEVGRGRRAARAGAAAAAAARTETEEGLADLVSSSAGWLMARTHCAHDVWHCCVSVCLCVCQEAVGPDGWHYHCSVCHKAGDVICCETCPKVFHRQCINMTVCKHIKQTDSTTHKQAMASVCLCFRPCLSFRRSRTSITARRASRRARFPSHRPHHPAPSLAHPIPNPSRPSSHHPTPCPLIKEEGRHRPLLLLLLLLQRQLVKLTMSIWLTLLHRPHPGLHPKRAKARRLVAVGRKAPPLLLRRLRIQAVQQK